MTTEDAKEYRKTLESQLKDKADSIQSTLTYVTAGALGLFLTINQDFFHLIIASCQWLAAASVISLLIAFCVNLYLPHLEEVVNEKLRDLIDNTADVTTAQFSSQIENEWIGFDISVKRCRRIVYVFLILGIISQISFLVVNINTKNPTEEPAKTITNVYLGIDSMAFSNNWKTDTIRNDSVNNTYIWLHQEQSPKQTKTTVKK